MSRIPYTAEAVADLALILEYHEERAGPEVAEALIDRVLSTIDRLLARHPRCGRRRPELGAGVCAFPVVPYVVFYRVDTAEVAVLRILHGRRDIRQPLLSFLIAG